LLAQSDTHVCVCNTVVTKEKKSGSQQIPVLRQTEGYTSDQRRLLGLRADPFVLAYGGHVGRVSRLGFNCH